MTARFVITVTFCLLLVPGLSAQERTAVHPDTSTPEWQDLFDDDLSNASYTEGVWRWEDRVLTAEEDEEIWTRDEYSHFVLDFEFRTSSGANSGVIIHADTANWVPNSLEIQIADDYHETWANAPGTWQAGAVFGHLAPDTSAVKPPGEWNRMTITSHDRTVSVALNGEVVSEMEMDRWTSAETNPDGSEIPEWLSVPVAELPARGHIGLQGKHGDAPVWFRNVRIRELE